MPFDLFKNVGNAMGRAASSFASIPKTDNNTPASAAEPELPPHDTSAPSAGVPAAGVAEPPPPSADATTTTTTTTSPSSQAAVPVETVRAALASLRIDGAGSCGKKTGRTGTFFTYTLVTEGDTRWQMEGRAKDFTLCYKALKHSLPGLELGAMTQPNGMLQKMLRSFLEDVIARSPELPDGRLGELMTFLNAPASLRPPLPAAEPGSTAERFADSSIPPHLLESAAWQQLDFTATAAAYRRRQHGEQLQQLESLLQEPRGSVQLVTKPRDFSKVEKHLIGAKSLRLMKKSATAKSLYAVLDADNLYLWLFKDQGAAFKADIGGSTATAPPGVGPLMLEKAKLDHKMALTDKCAGPLRFANQPYCIDLRRLCDVRISCNPASPGDGALDLWMTDTVITLAFGNEFFASKAVSRETNAVRWGLLLTNCIPAAQAWRGDESNGFVARGETPEARRKVVDFARDAKRLASKGLAKARDLVNDVFVFKWDGDAELKTVISKRTLKQIEGFCAERSNFLPPESQWGTDSARLQYSHGIYQTDTQGHTVMHLAVHAARSRDILSWLHRVGLDTNAIGGGYTPLHLAARNHDAQVVEWLLQNGARADARSPTDKCTPRELALKSKAPQAIVAMLEVAERNPGAFSKDFHAFLSYRVSTNSSEALLLRHAVRDAGLLGQRSANVYLDAFELQAGKPWDAGFCSGLVHSKVFVPILSAAAIAGAFTSILARPDDQGVLQDWTDNVLLEMELALALLEAGKIKAIFPVVVGPRDDSGRYLASDMRAAFQQCSAEPSMATKETAIEHLKSEGLGGIMGQHHMRRSVRDTLLALLDRPHFVLHEHGQRSNVIKLAARDLLANAVISDEVANADWCDVLFSSTGAVEGGASSGENAIGPRELSNKLTELAREIKPLAVVETGGFSGSENEFGFGGGDGGAVAPKARYQVFVPIVSADVVHHLIRPEWVDADKSAVSPVLVDWEVALEFTEEQIEGSQVVNEAHLEKIIPLLVGADDTQQDYFQSYFALTIHNKRPAQLMSTSIAQASKDAARKIIEAHGRKPSEAFASRSVKDIYDAIMRFQGIQFDRPALGVEAIKAAGEAIFAQIDTHK